MTVESRVLQSPRVLQVAGQFDLTLEPYSRLTWDVDLPLDAEPWHVGLICGPSGSGKSTIARRLFEDTFRAIDALPPWPDDRAVVDGFPEELPVKDVTALLSSVGFSSPPAWLRPYRVLSTGQRFRADLARLLAVAPSLPGQLAVMDEYTSVVDRTVAKVGSAAVAKAARSRGVRFVAVTCHDDVIDWLQPDWTYRVDAGQLTRRSLCPRPPADLELVRTTAAAWPLFAPHHYLSHSLNPSATCFLALVRLPGESASKPAAFSAWVNHLSAKGGKREHRTVVLPDYQGIGLGMHVSSTVAAMWTALGFRATSTTTHPAFIAARRRSSVWRLTRAPALAGGNGRGSRFNHATTRLTAGFVYTGPPLLKSDALSLLSA